MKTKLVKIFSRASKVPRSDFNHLNIKPEPTYHTQCMPLPEQTPRYSSDYDDYAGKKY